MLLDECVPRALRKELLGHDVKTVAEAGWAGVKNGELLQLAAGQFDILLTIDCNLEYQQNFAGLALAVIVVPRSKQRRCRASAIDAGGACRHSQDQAGDGDAYPRLTRH